ncbi:NUC153 domain-containing protein, partial [Toxoplasma gondii CAST]
KQVDRGGEGEVILGLGVRLLHAFLFTFSFSDLVAVCDRFTEKELRDLDLKEYLASSSSSEDEEGDCAQGKRWKLTESNLQEYRRQLLGDAADLSSDSENVESGDESKSKAASLPSSSNVKISFEGKLEDWSSSGDDDDEGDNAAGLTADDEETWKAYVERSKKKGKEQRRRQARQWEAAYAAADEEGEEAEEAEEVRAEGKRKTEQRRREKGKKFPIFAGAGGSEDEASASEEDSDRALSSSRKGGRKKSSNANTSTSERKHRGKNDASTKRKIENEEATKAELELLTLGHDEETRRHFDLRHELHNRPSKRKAKKMKRMREQEAATNPSEASSFKIDVDDDRFSRLFSNPEFAIDPTNPNFKKTAATDELLRVKRMRSSKLQFTRLKQKAVAGQDQQPSGLSFVSTAGPGKTGKSEKQKGKKGFTLFAKNA